MERENRFTAKETIADINQQFIGDGHVPNTVTVELELTPTARVITRQLNSYLGTAADKVQLKFGITDDGKAFPNGLLVNKATPELIDRLNILKGRGTDKIEADGNGSAHVGTEDLNDMAKALAKLERDRQASAAAR